MKTLFVLMAQFDGKAEIPLTEVCKQFLGLDDNEAKRQAAAHKLPFPAHRLGSQKSPWMVSIFDLAAYIEKQQQEAMQEWAKVNAA